MALETKNPCRVFNYYLVTLLFKNMCLIYYVFLFITYLVELLSLYHSVRSCMQMYLLSKIRST